VRLAFLIPDPDYPEAWNWAFDVEAEALVAGGATVDPIPWTSGADLSGYDLILPLVVWGYHLRYAEWLVFLDRCERERLPVVNPPALLRWNSDKAYLAEFDSRGVPTVHTMAVEALDEHSLAEARSRFGCSELVVKPPVSASATGTYKLCLNDPVPADAGGQRMLIQPFMASVAEAGEYSIMLFDGVYSHAIVKRPKAGDFRVQPHLGGSEVPCAAPAGSIELAKAALVAAPAPATYARVDMIADDRGELRIMELELIEPSLWLDLAPDKGAAFARSVRLAAERLSH
jgi:glutathione synthase/RimK-type ligase-like ATP-grasp enzyme